jgi:hypothetical protein
MPRQYRNGYPQHMFKHGFPSYFHKFELRPEDEIFFALGNVLTIKFDKMIGEYNSIYNEFIINKHSYANNLANICLDLNFFEALYDTDHELIVAMYRIKYFIDTDAVPAINQIDFFIDILYNTIATPSILSKISLMVEENYAHDINIDIKQSAIEKKRAILEFTNEQVKAILKSAYIIKVLGILSTHYVAMKQIKVSTISPFYDRIYQRSMNLFSDKFDIYNKTLAYIESKVRDSYNHNQPIYQQREIDGDDIMTITRTINRKYIMTDSIIKFRLQYTWNDELNRPKESVLSYYKAIPNYHLEIFLKQQFKYSIIEAKCEAVDDGNSKLDRLKMTLSRINEEHVILSDFAITHVVDNLCDSYPEIVTEDKIAYYTKYLKIEKIHIFFIEIYFSAYFGNSQLCNLLTNTQVIKLLILLDFLYFNEEFHNYSSDPDDIENLPILPFLFTANTMDKPIGKRVLTKDLKYINDNDLYKKVIDKRYRSCNAINPDFIINKVVAIMNNNYNIVCYEQQSFTGMEIIKDKDKIINELLIFILNAPDVESIYKI